MNLCRGNLKSDILSFINTITRIDAMIELYKALLYHNAKAKKKAAKPNLNTKFIFCKVTFCECFENKKYNTFCSKFKIAEMNGILLYFFGWWRVRAQWVNVIDNYIIVTGPDSNRQARIPWEFKSHIAALNRNSQIQIPDFF